MSASSCDVCLGGWDGDEADFYYESWPKARRVQKCCECRREIQRGEKYNRVAGNWDGYISTFRTCSLCHEIREVFSCGRGFLFGCLWENMAEYAFERLTTASPCFAKLSAAAKQFVLDRWREWKFQERP